MALVRRILLIPPIRWVLFGAIQLLISLPFSFLPLPDWLGWISRILLPLGALALLVWGVERRPLAEGGLGLQGSLRDLLVGLTGGGVLMGLVIGVLALLGWYRVEGFVWNGPLLLSAIAFWLEVAIREEVYFRAVLFRSVEEYLGSWASLAISALFFGLAHHANPNASWISSLGIAVEAGVLLAAAYMLTRSLWLAIGVHWGWNLFQGTIFGAPVSGLQIEGLLRVSMTGPEWATGGRFGPEAGLVAILLATAFGLGLLYWAAWRGQVQPPFWRRPKE